MRSCFYFVAALAFATTTLSADPAVAGPTGASVLVRVRAAVLSRPLSSIHSVRTSGTFEAIGLQEPATEIDDVADQRFVQDVGGDNAFVSGSNGFTGTVSWSKAPSGLVRIDGGEETRLQNVDQAYLQSFAYLAPNMGGAAAAYVGTKRVDGQEDDVIDVTPPGGTSIEMWIDRATGLIGKESTTVGLVTTTSTLTDYRCVEGLCIPFDVVSTDSNGNTFHTMTAHATLNVPDLAAALSVPISDVHDFSIAGGTTTTVPISIINDHIYVAVMLDGKGPFKFAFDTGGQNIVTPQVAALLHVKSAGSFNIRGVGKKSEAVQFTKVKTLGIGAATIGNQDFLVLPIGAGFGMSEGVKIDGLIGPAVPDRFLTTIDYANSRLTLALPESVTPQGSAVPFFFDGTIPELQTSIDGVAARTLLDTGNRGQLYLLTPFVASHPAIAALAKTGNAVTGFGVGGPSYGRLGRVPTVGIGPFELHGVVAALGTQHTGGTADPFIDANLGGGAWNRFVLALDYAHQRIFLRPNERYGSPFQYDRSGMFFIDYHGNVTLVGVTPNTPAARAGLQKGDQILAVDGKPASAYTLSQLRHRFMGAPGTTVELQVRSRDQQRTVRLTLASYV